MTLAVTACARVPRALTFLFSGLSLGFSSPDYKLPRLKQQTAACCSLGDVRIDDAGFSGSGGGLENSQRPSRAGVVDRWAAVRMRTQQIFFSGKITAAETINI